MLISPKYRFIFFKSKKCAGSSVEKALLQNCSSEALCAGSYNQLTGEIEYEERNNFYNDLNTGEEVQRFHAHTDPGGFFCQIKNPYVYIDYKKITNVRNPWDLMVSYYWWTVADARRFKTSWTDTPEAQNLIINDTDSDSRKKMKFLQWLLNKGNYPTYRNEGEFVMAGAASYMSDFSERFWMNKQIDYFIRFENLQDDLNFVCREIGMPTQTLEKLKTKNRKDKRYKEYYTEESKEIISNAFARSIKKFNYEF